MIAATHGNCPRPAAARLALMVAVACLAACGGGADDTPLTSADYTLIDEYRLTGITTARTRVARDNAGYASAWNDMLGNRATLVGPSALNFNTHAAVGMWLGNRPNGCAAVRIDGVVRLSDRIQVRYFERQPGPTELCAAVVTTPGALISLAHQGLPVEAVQVQCTNNCSR